MSGCLRFLGTAVLLGAMLSAQPGSVIGRDLIEPARPVTSKGLDNLRALARLFGFVRYFYPGDEAAITDWNLFAIAAVRAVEPAQTPGELATTLQSIFAPVAPMVRIAEFGGSDRVATGTR